VTSYDPCIEGIDQPPQPHPIVFCGDVLEHVEPDCLADVLRHLGGLTEEAALLVVHLGPAIKTLPDGRNAHLIQKPASWWAGELTGHGLRIVESDATANEAWFVVRPEARQ
jgi:hypothetical protein